MILQLIWVGELAAQAHILLPLAAIGVIFAATEFIVAAHSFLGPLGSALAKGRRGGQISSQQQPAETDNT
jgi:hypothetical protein